MIEKNLDLSGKVAVVTGASRGLGKAIALAMARQGVSVAICGRKQEGLDQAKEEFSEMGLEIMAQAANVGKADQVDALFHQPPGAKNLDNRHRKAQRAGAGDDKHSNAGQQGFLPVLSGYQPPAQERGQPKAVHHRRI